VVERLAVLLQLLLVVVAVVLLLKQSPAEAQALKQ
jgi:hypothetical protein